MQFGESSEYYQQLARMVRNKLVFPSDKRARNAWCVYQPSEQTELLESECGRNIYAEAFEFTEPIDSLKMLALKVILEDYSGGALSPKIQLGDQVWFGEHLKISMPIEDVVQLDVCKCLEFV